jgi:hypothetical protein
MLDAGTVKAQTGTLLSVLRGRQGAAAAGLGQEQGLLKTLRKTDLGCGP